MNEVPSCGLLIKQINSKLEKYANNMLREADLTFAQISALFAIRDFSEQQISLKELETLLRVAQSTTVGIVNRLEQKGLVESFGDPTDKRIKLVRITPLGEQYCRRGEQDMSKMEEKFLSGLTETEREILIALLQKADNTFNL